MALGDLTTPASFNTWLRVGGKVDGISPDDNLVAQLITQVSGVVRAFLQRPFLLSRVYTKSYHGRGSRVLILDEWPVTSVTSVTTSFGQITIPPAVGAGSGWRLEPWDGLPPGRQQAIYLAGSSIGGGSGGYYFSGGPMGVKVVFTAGYLISAEPQVVAAAGVLVNQDFGAWGADGGVTYYNGTALTKVSVTPSVGQYAIDPQLRGNYLFNATDVGQAVLISYSYIPAAIEQAVIEIVGERIKYRTRQGEASKSIQGEVISYSLKDMQDYVKLALQPYRKIWAAS